MTKTPYELRFDLLNFAQSTLTGEYYAALEQFRILQDNLSKTSEGGTLTLPSYPTVEQIFELANKYKDFIDQKN
jgi:hypothetical protein